MAEGKSIRDRISDDVTKGFDQATGVVVSNTRDVMSDAMSSLVDDVKGLTTGAWNMMSGAFSSVGSMFGFGDSSVDEKQLDEQEEQTGLLRSIKNIFKRQERADAVSFDEKKNLGVVGMIAFAIGALIGSIVGVIGLKFQVLFLALKGIGKMFTVVLTPLKGGKLISNTIFMITEFFRNIAFRIQGAIRRSRNLSKIFGMASTVFSKVGKAFKFVIGVFTKAFKFVGKLGIVQKFLSGFMFGFKKLMGPLQIIMSVIDFFQGFFGTEGSIIDKIKGGLERVVHDFIEFPVKLLGWISDGFLGLFGIKIEGGSAKKIMDGIMETVSLTIDAVMWPFEQIYETISGLWTSISEAEPNVGIFGKVKSLFSIVLDTLLVPFKALGEGLKMLKNIFIGDFEGFKENVRNISSTLTNLGDKIGDFITGFLPSGDDIKAGIGKIGNFLKSIFTDPISNIVNKVKEFFTGLLPSGDQIKAGLGKLGNFLKTIFVDPILRLVDKIKNFFTGLFPSGEQIKAGIGEIGNFVQENIVIPIKSIFGNIKDGFASLLPSGEQIKAGIGKILKGSPLGLLTSGITIIYEGIKGFFTGLIPSGEQIKAGIGEIGNFLKTIFVDPINNLVSKVKGFFSELFPSGDDIKEKFGDIKSLDIVKSVLGFPLKAFNWLKDSITGIVSSLGDKLTGGDKEESSFSVMDIIKSVLGFPLKTFNGLKDKITGIASSLGDKLTGGDKESGFNVIDIVKSVLGFPLKAFNWLKDSITGIVSSLGDKLTGGDKEKEGPSTIKKIVSTLTNLGGKIGDGVKGLIPSGEQIKAGIGEIGNFVQENIVIPIDNFVSKIKKGFGDLIPSGDDIKDKFIAMLDKLNPANWFKDDDENKGPSIGSTIKGGIKEAKDWILDKINPLNGFKSDKGDKDGKEGPSLLTKVGGFLSKAKDTFADKLNFLNPVSWFTKSKDGDKEGPSLLTKVGGFLSKAKDTFADKLKVLNPLNGFKKGKDDEKEGPSLLTKASGFLTKSKTMFEGKLNFLNPVSGFKGGKDGDENEESSSLLSKIGGFLTKSKTTFENKLNVLDPTTWFKKLDEDEKIAIKNKVSGFLTSAKDKFIGKLSAVKDFAIAGINKIKAGATKVKEGSSGVFSKATGAVTGFFGGGDKEKLSQDQLKGDIDTEKFKPVPITLNMTDTNSYLIDIRTKIEQLIGVMKKKNNGTQSTVVQQSTVNNQGGKMDKDIPAENEYLGVGLMAQGA